MLISWGEFFPGFDGKDSKVVGLMEAAHPPKETKLRSPADAGFGEIPHIGHQGGSALALSAYSKNQDAAWIFMQWVCSPDVMARVSTLGGGASPDAHLVLQGPARPRGGQGRPRHDAPLPGDRVDHQQRDGLRARHAGLGRDLEQRDPGRARQAAGRPVFEPAGVHGRDQEQGGRAGRSVPQSPAACGGGAFSLVSAGLTWQA